MRFLPSLQLLLFFFFLLTTTLSLQQPKTPYQCDETFSFFSTDIADAANLSHCRKLPTISAELGWNLHNDTFSKNKMISTVDFLFSAVLAASTGWVAWGVNPGPVPQMVGTRAIVGIREMDGGDGPVVVATYNITGEVRLGCKLVNSTVEFSVRNVRSSYRAATGMVVVAGRLMLPAAEYDVRRLNHVWQMGPAAAGMVLLPHSLRLQNFDGVETLDLVTGRKVGNSNTALRDAHGVLSVIGWGILLPIGVITVRYFKTFPFQKREWFLLHSSCQITAYVLGTTAWAIGLALLGSSKYYYTILSHRIIGILIFCLATLQMMALWLKPKRKDKYRKYWSIYHHFVGYSLIALVIVNIFKGFNILRPPPKWRWGYIGILSSIAGVFLIMEIITWYKFHQQQKRDAITRNKSKRQSTQVDSN
ncbi:hypothetical protein KFK09_009411 [Dendrobium nobile]|uniref:Cytochrome b561 and DOMON domain-containing protein n=1 Tax=Dendrobium nobile TaxID=94219 RepID=A0A8T3BJ90_DENNO|nr:hypothetical protein KFK09_009411 [Dendrobium nobile]